VPLTYAGPFAVKGSDSLFFGRRSRGCVVAAARCRGQGGAPCRTNDLDAGGALQKL